MRHQGGGGSGESRLRSGFRDVATARLNRAGFTLIEMVVVVLVIGILAALVMPNFDSARKRAHFSTIGQDFRNLGASQELYFQTHMQYAQSLSDLDFEPTPGVLVEVTEATTSGWAAVGTHESLGDGQGCSIYLGNAVPPPLPNGQTPSTGPGAFECAR